jgi:membrane-bound lytic murein transglycosylase B
MRKFLLLPLILLIGLGETSQASDIPFPDWLAAVKTEAVANGIDQAVVDQALGDVQPIDRVLELDRKQPEFTMTFDE